MRNQLELTVVVGLAIVFIPKPQRAHAPERRNLQDRRRVAAAQCTGTL